MYLRCLADDRPCSWLQWLSWAKYCFNTSYYSALRATPFEVVYGQPPPTLLSYTSGASKVVAVDQQLRDRDAFLADIRDCLLLTQDVMKEHHDHKR
jgi:hypothetical protein